MLCFAGMIYLGVTIYLNGADWVRFHPLNAASQQDANKLASGDIFDRNDTALLTVNGDDVRYSDDRDVRMATLHMIGDPRGNISTGVRTLYDDMLTGYNFKDGVYYLKEYGKGNNLYLTLDSSACAAAYRAMGKYKGAVGVMNYKTGELLCAVSTPSYDVNNAPTTLLTDEAYSGVFVNRLFQSKYTPGSTFKIVTSIAAIENVEDIYERTFTCRGKIQYGTGTVICHKSSGHGIISFKKALNVSCNAAFAQIAELVGADAMNTTANNLGFNRGYVIDGIRVSEDAFRLDGTSVSDLAWAGIGQYETTVTPIHMLMIAGAIANNGTGLQPYWMQRAIAPSGQTTYLAPAPKTAFTLSEETAQQMQTLLRSNVVNEYSDSKFPGLTMCGKTGTAEYDGQRSYAWFVGF